MSNVDIISDPKFKGFNCIHDFKLLDDGFICKKCKFKIDGNNLAKYLRDREKLLNNLVNELIILEKKHYELVNAF